MATVTGSRRHVARTRPPAEGRRRAVAASTARPLQESSRADRPSTTFCLHPCRAADPLRGLVVKPLRESATLACSVPTAFLCCCLLCAPIVPAQIPVRLRLRLITSRPLPFGHHLRLPRTARLQSRDSQAKSRPAGSTNAASDSADRTSPHSAMLRCDLPIRSIVRSRPSPSDLASLPPTRSCSPSCARSGASATPWTGRSSTSACGAWPRRSSGSGRPSPPR